MKIIPTSMHWIFKGIQRASSRREKDSPIVISLILKYSEEKSFQRSWNKNKKLKSNYQTYTNQTTTENVKDALKRQGQRDRLKKA